jgi:hypothetical protein
MTLKIEGIWCKTKLEFEKHTRNKDYDLVISHSDIYGRLLKSDPEDVEPSDTIISLYIQKIFRNIPVKYEGMESLNIAFLFKHLDKETVSNFKDFIADSFPENQIELIIIDRCDYPKRGVLSLFDSVKFIDND